jgi:hypothetical protein
VTVDFARRQVRVTSATLLREPAGVAVVLEDGHHLYYSVDDELEVER